MSKFSYTDPDDLREVPLWSNFPDAQDADASLRAALPLFDRQCHRLTRAYPRETQVQVIDGSASDKVRILSAFVDHADGITAAMANGKPLSAYQTMLKKVADEAFAPCAREVYGYVPAPSHTLASGKVYRLPGYPTFALDRQAFPDQRLMQVQIGTGVPALPLYPFMPDPSACIIALAPGTRIRVRETVRGVQRAQVLA